MIKGITISELRDKVEYNPDTGLLFWKPRLVGQFSSVASHRSWTTQFSEKPAFVTPRPDGSLSGVISNKAYLAHRIAWAIHYGKWPNEQIDHINGNRADNRISNLRDVTGQENQRNRRLSRNNTTGHHGVYWNKAANRWYAQMKIDGKSTHIGSYASKTDAIDARVAAERKYEFHVNHGKNTKVTV